MNTMFEEYSELNKYAMIDTYYDDIKEFKYFLDSLQEDRVESQKYIVNANREIERLNNIIDELENWCLSWKENDKYCYLSSNNKDKCRYDIWGEVLDKLNELKGSDE